MHSARIEAHATLQRAAPAARRSILAPLTLASYFLFGLILLGLLVAEPLLYRSEEGAALLVMLVMPILLLLLGVASLGVLVGTLVRRRERAVRWLAAALLLVLLSCPGLTMFEPPAGVQLTLVLLWGGAALGLLWGSMHELVGRKSAWAVLVGCGLPFAATFAWSAAAPLFAAREDVGQYVFRMVPWSPYAEPRVDLFARAPRGGLDYLGSWSSAVSPPFQGFGLAATGRPVVAEDGRSIVYAHAALTLRGRASRAPGIYLHSIGGEPILVQPASSLEEGWLSTEMPADLFLYRPIQSGTEGYRWALRPDGRQEPLALVDGTELHRAAFEGDDEGLVRLLAEGAALEARTRWGHTALEVALARCKEGAAVALLRNGAEPTAFGKHALLAAADLGLLRVLGELGAGPGSVEFVTELGPAAWERASSQTNPALAFGDKFDDESLYGMHDRESVLRKRELVLDWLRARGFGPEVVDD